MQIYFNISTNLLDIIRESHSIFAIFLWLSKIVDNKYLKLW